MPEVRLKHPAAIRWFHWVNFPLLFLMIWSGLFIYWAYDIYGAGPLHFFPKWFYGAFQIDHKLAEGMAMHFFFMWFFIANGVIYVAYTLFSGEWRYLVPRSRNSLRDAVFVLLYEVGLRKQEPEQEKYNAAQQFAYCGIIVMGFFSLLTGLAIYKPAQLSWLAACFGGYRGARFVHFWLTMGYVLFFIIHVVEVIRAGWNNFRGIVAGYEIVKTHE
jgi:thiosulfate reductase cytochrome b subunit